MPVKLFLRQASLQLLVRDLVSSINAGQLAIPAARPEQTTAEAWEIRPAVRRQWLEVSGIAWLLCRHLPTGCEQLSDRDSHRRGLEIAPEDRPGRPVRKSSLHFASSSTGGKHHVQVDSSSRQSSELWMWSALVGGVVEIARRFSSSAWLGGLSLTKLARTEKHFVTQQRRLLSKSRSRTHAVCHKGTLTLMLLLRHVKSENSKAIQTYALSVSLSTKMHSETQTSALQAAISIAWPYDSRYAISYWFSHTCISSGFRDNGLQTYRSHDLVISRSRVVIDHVTIRFALCHFLLVLRWNQGFIFISNRFFFRYLAPQMLTNQPTNKLDGSQYLMAKVILNLYSVISVSIPVASCNWNVDL